MVIQQYNNIITDQMNEYPPVKVYDNLHKMLAYRNIVADSRRLSDNDLIQVLNQTEYTTITGTRTIPKTQGHHFLDETTTVKVAIVLVAPKSKYALKSPEFKKLFINFDKYDEVMFVCESEANVKIINYINTVKNGEYDKETKLSKIYIEYHPYGIFLDEVPMHQSVPRHEIMPEAEINDICAKRHTSRFNFPKIKVTDAPVVWLGAKPGQCVKIYRLSETAGNAIGIRLVIPVL